MKYQRIEGAERIAAESAMKLHLEAAVDIACRNPGGRKAIGEALCAALDTVGGGAPVYGVTGDMREDAALWAELATPLELEAYAAQALHRITRTTFALRARKRLFWQLWESMSTEDRASFLRRAQNEEPPP